MSGSASFVVAEVPLSAHSITLEHGTYCVFVTAVSPGVPPEALPALQISTAPGNNSIALGTLPGDGWLRQVGDAVLIRVVNEKSRLLLTSYDEARVAGAKPPQIQVQRLDDSQPQAAAPRRAVSGRPDVLAHIRRHGDRTAPFGAWLGEVGGDSWIEGFQIAPPPGLTASDLEYQVVLGRGWQSPWVAAGSFCGSRGMGLPILGLRARLIGEAAQRWQLRYAARCVDGRELAEVAAGESCEAPELVPLAALRISLDAVAASARRTERKRPAPKKA